MLFLWSLALADELELDCIVLIFDLAFYAKTQRVHWNDPIYMERTVVRLGEFHTLLFFSIIGKRFDDLGLTDSLLEAGTVAEGSQQGVLNGKHYNRSIKVVKTCGWSLETGYWLLPSWIHLSEQERDLFTALCTRLRQTFPKPCFQELTCTSNEFQEFSTKLSSFIQRDVTSIQLSHFGWVSRIWQTCF